MLGVTLKSIIFGFRNIRSQTLECAWKSYNHGQKSWDKFAFVALFHTRRTLTREFIYTCSGPTPLPPLQQKKISLNYHLNKFFKFKYVKM